MRHFSCDLCGKDLTTGEDARFVLRMEVYPASESTELTEADLDQDHVETMAEMLQELEDSGEHAVCVPTTQKLQYDLCGGCHNKFVADPLGRESKPKLQFSKN